MAIADLAKTRDDCARIDREQSAVEALRKLFEIGRAAVSGFAHQLGAKFTAPGWMHFGHANVSDLVSQVEQRFPLTLTGPFEGTASISGAIWPGSLIPGATRRAGLAKLAFGEGTVDLPMHAHEYSDRFIVVLGGSGFFHFSAEHLRGFSPQSATAVPVRSGDALMFSRGLVHTFSAPSDDLVLLSYHSPLIAFDDPRQFTIPEIRWSPAQQSKG